MYKSRIAADHLTDIAVGVSGYKADMGAREGCRLIDLPIVRSRTAALMVAPAWGEARPPCSAFAAIPPDSADRG